MFWFKACTKCGGDIYEDTDLYGVYIACLQCGRHLAEIEKAFKGPFAPIESARFIPLIPKEKVAA